MRLLLTHYVRNKDSLTQKNNLFLPASLKSCKYCLKFGLWNKLALGTKPLALVPQGLETHALETLALGIPAY